MDRTQATELAVSLSPTPNEIAAETRTLMARQTQRGAKEGIGFGVVAGIIFAVVEVIGAAMMNNPPLMPFRMFASVLIGEAAMESTPIGTAVLVGSLAHIALSAAFGLVYGIINAGFSTETQTNWTRQGAIGLLFGAILWFVNFQIIARIVYPWFLMSPQLLQALMHALFFGLPLGLMYAGAERRVQQVRRARAPTPA